MSRLLFFIVILIIYGSLYPFKFSGQLPGFSETLSWITNYSLQTTRSDIIANIILFVPYGFVARIYLNQSIQRIRGVILLIGLAIILAFSLQYLQFLLPARVPDASDALYNILGTFVGITFSHLLLQYSHNHLPQDANKQTSWSQVSIPLLLALLWVCWRWFPFIPLATTESIITNLNPLINKPELDLFTIIRDGIGWLVFFYLLSQPPFDSQPRFRVLKIAFFILSIELFIINNELNVNDLLATLGAFALYASLDYRAIQSSVTWSLILAMILTWLTPLTDYQTSSSLNLIPFASYLKSNPWIATEYILMKLYFIGALIYILKSHWLDYKIATLVTLLLVFTLIIVQVISGDFRPDITDCVAVLFLGWAMFLLDKQAVDERTLAMKS